MSAQHWVMIGLTLWSTWATFAMWLLNRRVKRQDKFEEKLEEFAGLSMKVAGISEEGIEREKRLTAALERQTLTLGSHIHELKNEIRQERTEMRREIAEQRIRVDELMRLDRGGGYRRV